jgi:ABC-type dipeptide/oligopeptide/nickel transport system permease component
MFIGAFYVLLNLIADIVTILATPKLRLPSR